MLRAVQARDFERMYELSKEDISSTYHRNKFLSLALEAGREVQALEFARFEVRRNERNDFGWRVIASLGSENVDEVHQAVETLKNLDPFNFELQSQLEDIGK